MEWRRRSLRQRRRKPLAHAPEHAQGHALGQSGLHLLATLLGTHVQYNSIQYSKVAISFSTICLLLNS